MLKRMACVAFVCLPLVGCETLPTLSTPESPQFLISDGAHNSGNEHFFFLPPMTDEVIQNAVFDHTLAPEVVVCVWNENSCASTIAAFTTQAGSGSETIRLDAEEEHYIVNWHTDEVAEDFVLSEDEIYRIRVLANGQELGFADVVVVSNGAALRTVLTDGVVALVEGRTLPIKFRIEEGALDQIQPSVNVGDRHACSLRQDGTAYCWGYNYQGQVGNGVFNTSSPYSQPSPTPVNGDLQFQQITTGNFHSCGLTTDAVAYCWGNNYNGQAGTGSRSSTPPYGISQPVVVQAAPAFVSLRAGGNHTCGLTEAGEIYCWGSNYFGQTGVGYRSSVVLSPRRVVGNQVFTSISAGSLHTCAIASDDTVHCWGLNNHGELGTGSVSSPKPSPQRIASMVSFASVAASWDHTCSVSLDHDAYCWGYNATGALGLGYLSPSTSSAVPTPQPVISGQYVTVAPGGLHTCGITTTDELYCWGSNAQGQLGTGVHEPPYLYPYPLAVNGTETFKDVDAGWYSTCAVSSSNQVYCWGLNQAGQLGQGFVSGLFEPWPDPLPVMTLNSTE